MKLVIDNITKSKPNVPESNLDTYQESNELLMFLIEQTKNALQLEDKENDVPTNTLLLKFAKEHILFENMHAAEHFLSLGLAKNERDTSFWIMLARVYAAQKNYELVSLIL